MSQTTLRIAAGDLRHKTVGKHSPYMPINLGYIFSYMLAHIDAPQNIDVRFYDDPEILFHDIPQWQPQVIALSNYCWNAELSWRVFKYAKSMRPETVCISGGPEFPLETAKRQQYLTQRREIDFYVYFEGEISFTRLVQKILNGEEISALKSSRQYGVVSIHPKTGEVVIGATLPRLIDLDDIPSPYVNGMMDQWFNGYYAPSVETARGCPFTCTYCSAGDTSYNHIATFSIHHLQEELEYIAKKMSAYPSIPLKICDSDFGMFKHDEEVAECIRNLQNNFGWPQAFYLANGNRNFDRILRISERLHNRLPMRIAAQSLNPKTLEAIKRKNPPIEVYADFIKKMQERGIMYWSEVILPLPEETQASVFQGIKDLMDIGIRGYVINTTMLLRGTELTSEANREKYGLQTKFRLLPRQFGEYVGEKCFETEEVCVATNTMSFEEYLECCGFGLISTTLSNEQFDLIHLHLRDLNIPVSEYLFSLWHRIKSGDTEVSDVYANYLQERTDELWDPEEALREHFAQPENYAKLLTGESGDNLIRKYRFQFLFDRFLPAINLMYQVLVDVADEAVLTPDIQESLEAAKQWTLALRNVNKVFEDDLLLATKYSLVSDYDVASWYDAGPQAQPLSLYKKNVHYRIFYQTKRIQQILDEGKRLYGDDLLFRVGRLFTTFNIKDFWAQCEPLEDGTL